MLTSTENRVLELVSAEPAEKEKVTPPILIGKTVTLKAVTLKAEKRTCGKRVKAFLEKIRLKMSESFEKIPKKSQKL